MSNLEPAAQRAIRYFQMRLESEVRRPDFTEKRYVHGKWRIVKIYFKGQLREIIVNHLDEHSVDEV